ncbi:hypothetical protein CTEN210_07023 [Chaetoceros tenuissimus]|uniref:PI3K/PI4K catalytic domain-containing protein n=1 Tax=Chaetoceros tenuissimus TaxID=426638 RepID=A0AAD3CQY4_9STRA|nr:hypothetical protein CTEN210_07023 [Chaetoceros tenuissimus]
MVHATQFLLRWLYLNNLIHERAEIQSLPYIHPNWHPNQSSHDVPYQQHQHQHQHIQSQSRYDHHSTHPMEHSVDHQQQQQQSTEASNSNMTEQQRSEVEWRRKALQTIALYPPGSLRLLALDTLRLEIVHEFARELNASDEILSRYFSHKSMGDKPLGDSNNNDYTDTDEEEVDFNLAREFQDATSISIQDSVLDQQHDISNEERNDTTDDSLLSPQVQRALTLHRETREYLPQFVSAILHSPAPLTQSTMYTPHLNPLATLRKLLLLLCANDPNLGIVLCWLLEAEVGRAWKSLFEHRQQTGRRLIVLLPADRAAAIQQIGLEKRAAFDLLQDVESATAYGAYEDDDSHHHHSRHGEFVDSKSSITSRDLSDLYHTSRLPASMSLKRCSHFGDTMHFIDLLTRISLDLRMCPPHLRGNYLTERLEDVNRRLRRRMVTNGSVSLDVDDNRGSHDWPTLSDVSTENIQHSIHFPLEPIATTWPSGTLDFEEMIDSNLQSSAQLLKLKTENGVMRVLNIISSKSRVLASRERCPYLVHCEVLETGMEGRDARLYLQHSQVEVTIQEALGTTCENKNKAMESTYKIPSELSPFGVRRKRNNDTWNLNTKSSYISRGGDQSDHKIQSSHSNYRGCGIQNMQNGRFFGDNRSPYYQERATANQDFSAPALTTHSNLLDRVYGKPWAEICEEVRNSSVFGQLRGWKLASFIMKAGEDIRREALVMQVISKIHNWFETEISCENRPYLKPYTIMCVGGDAGLLECIRDAKSVDEVKKSTDGFTTLREYFERAYGLPTSNFGRNLQSPIPLNEHGISFEKAQDNFLKSLVGYSLVCYILQIKDRHNANILLDRDGHIIHIDFGFVLGDTPKMAKVPLFNERAPFKLTSEFWEVIGGWNFNEGGLGVRFCNMFEEAFACASTHSNELAAFIEAAILNLTQNPAESKIITNGVRNRLQMRGPRGSVQQKTFVMNLVNAALTSWGTSTYDWLQKSMNGYI